MHAFRLALLATSLLATSAPALAQTNDADVLFDEVITRATKSVDPETVQDVPIAVTAANAETLEALQVRTLEDLTFYAPNVVLADIGTSRGTANFSIRGLGINSSIPSIDPTVGVFVDGVYLGFNAGVVFDTFDLESVELLRGPQGLLFGRNTTGGAVLVNTKNPTDEVEVEARFAVESPLKESRGDANYYYMGSVTGPLVEDRLNGKVAFYHNDDGGYFSNPGAGRTAPDGTVIGLDVGQNTTTIVRGGLDFLLSDNANLLVKGEWFNTNGDGPVAQNRGTFDRDSFDVAYDNVGFIDARAYSGSAQLTFDVPFGEGGQITNILGYRDYTQDTDADIDSTSAFLFHSTTELAQDQVSNELRYNGGFGKFDLTTGVFLFDQDINYTEVRDLPPASPLTFYGGGRQEQFTAGVFANVDFEVTEDFFVTLGGRYSYEEKEAGVTYVRPRFACTLVNIGEVPTCPTDGINTLLFGATGGALAESNGFRDEDTWENFTPKVGLQYLLNDSTNLYASYAKGFRSGGYNFRITNVPLFEAFVAGNGGDLSFDEEEVDTFEVGAKFTSDDRRIVLNAAGFFNDVSDLQREVNVSSPTAGVSQFIFNTADAEIFGAELEGRFRVLDNVVLTGNVGYIDASYTEVRADLNQDNLVNELDEALELPRVPELTYGAGLIADFGPVSGRVNFQHRDETAYTDSNFGFIQAIDDLSASLGVSLTDYATVRLYGKNLLDEVQAGGDTQVPFGGPTPGLIPGTDTVAFFGERSNFVNAAFDDNPRLGTFSPLKKGRVFGLELSVKFGEGDF